MIWTWCVSACIYWQCPFVKCTALLGKRPVRVAALGTCTPPCHVSVFGHTTAPSAACVGAVCHSLPCCRLGSTMQGRHGGGPVGSGRPKSPMSERGLRGLELYGAGSSLVLAPTLVPTASAEPRARSGAKRSKSTKKGRKKSAGSKKRKSKSPTGVRWNRPGLAVPCKFATWWRVATLASFVLHTRAHPPPHLSPLTSKKRRCLHQFSSAIDIFAA